MPRPLGLGDSRDILQVTALEKTLKKPKNIKDIMTELESGTKIDKQKLLSDLAALEANESVLVKPEEVIAALRNISEGATYALDEDGGTEESCKWYDHEKKLKSFSKVHPNWLFTLSGEGE